jgi:pilus assembly protein Flp/PilA
MEQNEMPDQTKTMARDESGATAVEYGLMLALIAVFIMGAVTAMSGQLDAMYTMIAGLL